MRRVFICLALLASAACSGGSSSGTPTTPSSPPLAPTNETFTGTVSVGGSDTHQFVVKLSNGLVTATLTAAGPPPTIAMGLGIGTIASGTCTLIPNGSIITPAGTSPQLSGTNFQAGTYCVGVFDVGQQTGDVTYSVTVAHY
ncbi:MAG TPA: hypothetical protein VF456_05605 [Vicinamibacterales bacterium]